MEYVKLLYVGYQLSFSEQVRYLLGWDETVGIAAINDELCHPLCQCDRCAKLRKVCSST